MIITKLIGGLGNQMFQYALGRHLALKNKTSLKFDLTGYKKQTGIIPRRYGLYVFSIQENFAVLEEINKLKYRQRFWAALKLKNKKSFLKEKKAGVFNEEVLKRGDNLYLDGFWQTEKYFKDIRDIIIKDFSLKKEYNKIDEQIFKKIKNYNSVSLHIRRRDYVNDIRTKRFHGNCSLSYYLRAIKYISAKISEPFFFIFSDDTSWAKENLKINFPLIYVSNGRYRDYEELILMSKCRHNIIANSSFSWWAAWLNQNNKKIVIAPAKWFNNDLANSNDIIPNNWIKMPN